MKGCFVPEPQLCFSCCGLRSCWAGEDGAGEAGQVLGPGTCCVLMGAEEQDEELWLLLSPPNTEGRYKMPRAIYSMGDVHPSALTLLLTPSSHSEYCALLRSS